MVWSVGAWMVSRSGIGRRVGRVERRVRRDHERAVQLRVVLEMPLHVVGLEPELHVVIAGLRARDVPAERVGELRRVGDPVRAGVPDAVLEGQVGQVRPLAPHRRLVGRDAVVEVRAPDGPERRVLLARREAVGREAVVFARQRQTKRVDAVGAEHRVHVDRSGVVAIPFLLRGGEGDRGVVGLILLRRPLGDPARAPAGVRADLVIDAVDRVPDARFGDGRVVQVRPRGNLNRAALRSTARARRRRRSGSCPA